MVFLSLKSIPPKMPLDLRNLVLQKEKTVTIMSNFGFHLERTNSCTEVIINSS